MQEVLQAVCDFVDGGFAAPSWGDLAAGARPPQRTRALPELDDDEQEQELGEFTRGWQRAASVESDAAEFGSFLTSLDPTSRALLLSQAGPFAGRVFTAVPTALEFTVPSHLFRVLLLRRLRLPLPLCARRCRCGRDFDVLGDHRSSCSRAGVLGPRGYPLEVAAARVCREAGARVSENVFLRDLNLDVPVADGRRLEVVASGLPLWSGTQLAVDTTLVCPVRASGEPRRTADRVPGVALRAAVRRKRRYTYPELLRARRCKLLVLAFEVGGRWDQEAVAFVRKLARRQAQQRPWWLHSSVTYALVYRWSALLAVTAQRSFAASLLHLPAAFTATCGEVLTVDDVVVDARFARAPDVSRVPLRG